MTHPVTAVIRHAVAKARQRTDPAGFTTACIAALAKLRRTLDRAAGDRAASEVVDGPVAIMIRQRSQQNQARTGATPVASALPSDILIPSAASTILLDAVDSGLTMHEFMPDNSALILTMAELTAALLDNLDTPPDAEALLSRLRDDAEELDEADEAVTPHVRSSAVLH